MLKLEEIDIKLGRLLKESDDKKTAAQERRRLYREAKKTGDEGLVKLPPHHILKRRNACHLNRITQYIKAGLQFADANDPEGFVSYVVWQWNSATYLKKPITYSGGYYRVHIGDIRVPYGVFDLMGYNKKQKPALRRRWAHWSFERRSGSL